jgi:hypothetical protein
MGGVYKRGHIFPMCHGLVMEDNVGRRERGERFVSFMWSDISGNHHFSLKEKQRSMRRYKPQGGAGGCSFQASYQTLEMMTTVESCPLKDRSRSAG